MAYSTKVNFLLSSDELEDHRQELVITCEIFMISLNDRNFFTLAYSYKAFSNTVLRLKIPGTKKCHQQSGYNYIPVESRMTFAADSNTPAFRGAHSVDTPVIVENPVRTCLLITR